MTVTYNFKHCPFCGHDLNKQESIDTLNAAEVEDGYWVYNVVCDELSGVCDATVLGDSREEVYEKWDTRVNKNKIL